MDRIEELTNHHASNLLPDCGEVKDSANVEKDERFEVDDYDEYDEDDDEEPEWENERGGTEYFFLILSSFMLSDNTCMYGLQYFACFQISPRSSMRCGQIKLQYVSSLLFSIFSKHHISYKTRLVDMCYILLCLAQQSSTPRK
jgi:hypothetical protein